MIEEGMGALAPMPKFVPIIHHIPIAGIAPDGLHDLVQLLWWDRQFYPLAQQIVIAFRQCP